MGAAADVCSKGCAFHDSRALAEDYYAVYSSARVVPACQPCTTELHAKTKGAHLLESQGEQQADLNVHGGWARERHIDTRRCTIIH